MTVRDWITSRTPPAPRALTEQILAALGSDADAPAARTGEVCLAAAARGLDAVLTESRFGRDDALELLAIDALTTFAFEYASQAVESEAQLAALAKQGAHTLGQHSAQRV